MLPERNKFSNRQVLGLMLSLMVIGAFFYFNFFVFESSPITDSITVVQAQAADTQPAQMDTPTLPAWMVHTWVFIKQVVTAFFHLMARA